MKRAASIPPGSLLGATLRLPLRLIPKQRVVTVRSGVNQGLKWIVGSSIHGCWLGHYEQDKQEIVRRVVRPGMNVLDIGANAGFYTLAFSRLVGPSGHVWAFEPFAENAQNLLRHVALNGLTNVTVIQAAVSGHAGLAGFQIAASNSMGSLSNEQNDYLIPTLALDHLLERGTVPIPDVIKIDVEGAEALVLRGARRMLAIRRSLLLIALHGAKAQRDCVEQLAASSYRLTLLDGRTTANPDVPCDEVIAWPLTEGIP